ncbi:MAG: hypothetical protein HY821_08675 [Acidobacteria bacterium]|nr:hypothetical protein [Acidobacteriota bacterium]
MNNPSPLSRRSWLSLLPGALALPAADPALPALLPHDQASRDAALAALLARIRGAARQRDFKTLEAMMLATFRVEFDSGKGPGAFHRYWKPESPSSPLWEVLERLFALGGTFYSPSLFAVSYVYTRFPPDLDILGHVVALRDNVPLLAEPQAGAARLAEVSHAILPLAAPLKPPVRIPSAQFLEVRHPSAARAFVSAGDVYSPAAHRAFFEKAPNGRWRWISLACATLAEPPDLYARKPAAKRKTARK